MKQIFTPSLYTSGDLFKAETLKGYENRFGSYLTSLILNSSVKEENIITDGINFTDKGFLWKIKFKDIKNAQVAEKLLSTNDLLEIKIEGSILYITL